MPSRLSAFHEGEVAMHRALKVPPMENPTFLGLPARYGARVMQSPLVALGTLDAQGRPWTTIWGGERGFARPVAEGVLGLNGVVDKRHDPVFRAFWAAAADEQEREGEGQEEEVVRPREGGRDGKMMAALSIDLDTRDRVKLAGRMVAGAQVPGKGEVQVAMLVTESMGNCPKYINKKDLVPCAPQPELVVASGDGGDAAQLPEQAVDLIRKADMLFLSSTNGETMDTNHRGGPPGFVRVVRNDGEGVELAYPEYSGNRLYQTLGNFRMNPLVGIVIPDFETSDAIYLTGSASVLVGQEASSLIARSHLAVKITVTASRFVRRTLPFRGTPKEFSPYNPPVRHLLSERQPTVSITTSSRGINATLIRREVLTPTIGVFTFRLESPRTVPVPRWHAGQHVTLDFEMEVGGGYAHMRDEDPQSLNDDYLRTFTISSPPPAQPRDGAGGRGEGQEIEITARLHGPVTRFLWKHNLRAPLDVPFLGFGGEAAFRLPTTTVTATAAKEGEGQEMSVFVAGGVGITPLLAQARGVLDGGVALKLLWTLRGEDVPLAEHVFDKIPGLASVTTLFVTATARTEDVSTHLDNVRGRGAVVEERRISANDVEGLKGKDKGEKKKFYLCAGPGLLKLLMDWLEGEDMVWEDFGY